MTLASGTPCDSQHVAALVTTLRACGATELLLERSRGLPFETLWVHAYGEPDFVARFVDTSVLAPFGDVLAGWVADGRFQREVHALVQRGDRTVCVHLTVASRAAMYPHPRLRTAQILDDASGKLTALQAGVRAKSPTFALTPAQWNIGLTKVLVFASSICSKIYKDQAPFVTLRKLPALRKFVMVLEQACRGIEMPRQFPDMLDGRARYGDAFVDKVRAIPLGFSREQQVAALRALLDLFFERAVEARERFSAPYPSELEQIVRAGIDEHLAPATPPPFTAPEPPIEQIGRALVERGATAVAVLGSWTSERKRTPFSDEDFAVYAPQDVRKQIVSDPQFLASVGRIVGWYPYEDGGVMSLTAMLEQPGRLLKVDINLFDSADHQPKHDLANARVLHDADGSLTSLVERCTRALGPEPLENRSRRLQEFYVRAWDMLGGAAEGQLEWAILDGLVWVAQAALGVRPVRAGAELLYVPAVHGPDVERALRSLPLAYDRAAIVETFEILKGLFVPHARELATELGIPYPALAEQALAAAQAQLQLQ